ncbi:para-nitrobenzyl esterase [Litorivivens lipolytica]|uniref:Carboxylic ester hydrolase n=1 Tax=Litorivivens lipolytica TaxID=1524264 RepID=A0A7W4W4P3_9GAMM|nr:carboxylesterase family protein [Litorivivens lipolytica]MBB3047362.1 para-nitrobenzyl esterase [Litorivivens lipolytica]
MRKGLVLAVIVVAAVSGYLFVGGDEPAPERIADPQSLRKLPAGEIVGYRDKFETHAWRGVPFAQPPVGELRWKAPRSLASWSGQRNALEVGPPCVQFWGGSAGVPGDEGELVGSEDCLTLSVWAPAMLPTELAAAQLPVMVWVHGGGNSVGTGNTYNGHHLAGSQQVIVVTVNYRLGVLGWFSHEALRNEDASAEDVSGNYGLLDIVAALKWVKSNIAAFGGDPDNVTVFGESAGGRNVYALIASPSASGLFHRAIVQSGSTLTVERSWAENTSDQSPRGAPNSSGNVIQALREAGVLSTVTESSLRALSIADLHSVFEAGGFGMYSIPSNIRDGKVLPLTSLQAAFASGSGYNRVPIMVGTNRDESKVFMAQDETLVTQRFGLFPTVKDQEHYDTLAALYSDQWKVLSVDEPARLLAANDGPNVYAYRFDWDETPSNWLVDMPSVLGAGHALELGFVFGDFEGGISLPFLYNEENLPGREQLSQTMMGYWGEFARSGDPGRGNGQSPQWEPWDAQHEVRMVFDTDADNGVRMVSESDSVSALKQRLTSSIASHDLRCKIYVELFLTGFQSREYWSQQEYTAAQCSEIDPYQRAFASP